MRDEEKHGRGGGYLPDDVPVVAMRVADYPVPAVPSRKEPCRGCGENCWVSQALNRRPVVCIRCSAANSGNKELEKKIIDSINEIKGE